MNGVVSAALLLVGACAVAALGLALAVARRLRLVQEQLAALDLPLGPDLPAPGQPVPDFTAITTTRETVGTRDLAGPDLLVLFLDGTCTSCFDAATRLRDTRAAAGAGEPVPVAVVVGAPQERAGLVAELEPVARVIEESYEAPLARRFGVRGFPAALLVGGGVIRAASHRLEQVELGLPA